MHDLDRVLERQVFLRMFLPLVALSVVAIGMVGYLGARTLEQQQLERVRYIVRLVDLYLDLAARTVDAVARTAEETPSDSLSYMRGTWQAYGYFDTLYQMDAASTIRQLVPPDPHYLGLDMSNLPYFNPIGETKGPVFSRPFISLRTGNPTVYLARRLARGGQVVGELNLGALQEKITSRRDTPNQGTVLILDRFGMLLAHPSTALVRQQTNQGDLEIFRRGLLQDTTMVYDYDGTRVLGSAARVEQAGWVVVDQVPLVAFFRFHVWAMAMTLLASSAIWLALTLTLRKQLHRRVAIPLAQLSHGINALTNGNFGKGRNLAAIPAAFTELTALATDFQHMSDALEARQAALLESEQRYRTLFDRVPAPLFRSAADGKLLDANPANVQMMGYPDQETLMKTDPAKRYVNPEDCRQWREMADRCGLVRDFETRLRRFDGSVIWGRLTCRAVRNESGQVLYHEGCLEDITARRQAEALVRMLSQAIEQCPVSIVITDLDGVIEFVNTAFTQITGYTHDEVMGQTPRILKSGETSLLVYKQLWETIRSGGVWRGELCNRKKNGELYLEHASIFPVRNGNDAITHYGAVKEDVTDRKKLEEQVRQIQKMEAVGQLAGGVAHDFNNMLGVIIGHADLALEKVADDASLCQNIETIRDAAHRSMEITRQLLAFARKQTIVPKILDINRIVGGTLNLLRRLIGENINLIWLPGTEIWPVRMDPSQIDQILANLCVNARDAIGGVGRVTIETRNVVFDDAYCADHKGFSPGEYVMLAVSDNGCGMDRQTRDRIFEPFFTTKGANKGTGLGLATVYGIIKQNAGFINVYSEVGQGSTFTLYIPRNTVRTEFPQSEESSLPVPRGHETILLVEDESAFLDMTKLLLEKLGYTVLAFLTPTEALGRASAGVDHIDLLISDLVMPEMNGLDLARRLNTFNPGIRNLFMSGYTGNVATIQGVLEEGANFMQKPFSLQELALKVREALSP
ncbi:MAG: PAS domain S-box protein [Pseudomonadota bacterium]